MAMQRAVIFSQSITLSIKSTAVVSAVIASSLICILPIFMTGLYFYIAQPTKEEVDDSKLNFK